MIDSIDQVEELRQICAEVREMNEAGVRYLYLKVTVHGVGELEGLLRPQAAASDSYTTRLFLSQPVPGKGENWTTHRILDRTWHTWSWNNVHASGRLAEILANHLRALR
jgi:hypothetical protein